MEKGVRQWVRASAPAALNFPVRGAFRCRATSRRARPRASARGRDDEIKRAITTGVEQGRQQAQAADGLSSTMRR